MRFASPASGRHRTARNQPNPEPFCEKLPEQFQHPDLKPPLRISRDFSPPHFPPAHPQTRPTGARLARGSSLSRRRVTPSPPPSARRPASASTSSSPTPGAALATPLSKPKPAPEKEPP